MLCVERQRRPADGSYVSMRPYSKIAYHDGGRFRTQNAWECLDGRTPVLWGPRLDAALLHQAELCNGLISLMRLERVSAASVIHYIRQAEPVPLLGKALRFARPWREALISWADGASDIEVEELLLAMEGYPGPLSRLGISPRLRGLLARRRCASRVWMNEHIAITEREGGTVNDLDDRSNQSR